MMHNRPHNETQRRLSLTSEPQSAARRSPSHHHIPAIKQMVGCPTIPTHQQPTGKTERKFPKPTTEPTKKPAKNRQFKKTRFPLFFLSILLSYNDISNQFSNHQISQTAGLFILL